MRLVSAFAFPETASFTSLRIDRIALADRTGPVSLADGNPLVERLFENRAQIALSPRSAAAAGMTRLEPGLLWGPAVANNIYLGAASDGWAPLVVLGCFTMSSSQSAHQAP